MRYKRIAESPKTFALIMETADEILNQLKRVARTESFGASSFKAIGAMSYVQQGREIDRQFRFQGLPLSRVHVDPS